MLNKGGYKDEECCMTGLNGFGVLCALVEELEVGMRGVVFTGRVVLSQKGWFYPPKFLPPPPCISYALVQATVGVGTVIIVYVILIMYEM